MTGMFLGLECIKELSEESWQLEMQSYLANEAHLGP